MEPGRLEVANKLATYVYRQGLKGLRGGLSHDLDAAMQI